MCWEPHTLPSLHALRSSDCRCGERGWGGKVQAVWALLIGIEGLLVYVIEDVCWLLCLVLHLRFEQVGGDRLAIVDMDASVGGCGAQRESLCGRLLAVCMSV